MTSSHFEQNFIELLKSHNLKHKWIKIIANQIHDLAILGADVRYITGFDNLSPEIQSAIREHYNYLHKQYTDGL